MKVYIEKDNVEKNIGLKKKTLIKDILKDLKISNSSVVISKNDIIVLEDEFVSDEDDLKLLSVVSGG